MQIKYKEDEMNVTSKLLGSFNMYNILAAAGVCIQLGFEFKHIYKKIE